MAKIGDAFPERRYKHKLLCPNPNCGEVVMLMTDNAAHGSEALDPSNSRYPHGGLPKQGEVIKCLTCQGEVFLSGDYVRIIEHFKMEVKA